MIGLAKVGVWVWRVGLIVSWHTFLALPLGAASEDISELERYKRSLQNFEGSSDPARAAQLRQMQRLLTLMQRSLVIDDANKKSPIQPPVAKRVLPDPVEETPPSPETDPQSVIQPAVAVEPKVSSVPVVSAPSSKQASLVVKSKHILADQLEPEIPEWFFQVELSASIGYRENILRSAFSNLDSALLRGSAQVQLMNTQRDGFRVMALGQYEGTHFLDEPSVRDEDLLFMLGQADQRIAGNVWLGLQASYFSAHQPLDDPDLIDLDTGSIPLKFDQLSISSQFTWEPSKAHAWVAHVDYRREATEGLETEEQDNDQWGLGLRYTFEPGSEHRFQVNYQFTETDYDERRARTSSGTFLDDALETRRNEWSASYRRTWEQEETRWRAEARLRWVLEDDDVGGYDDVARVELRGRLSWLYRKRTEVLAELRYGEYFYDSRQQSGDVTRLRERSFWAGAVTLEHAFNKRLTGLFRYDFIENAGNRRVDRYGNQTLSTGIRLTF